MRRILVHTQRGYLLFMVISLTACSAGTKSVSHETTSEMSIGHSDLGVEQPDLGASNDTTDASGSGHPLSTCESGYQAPQAMTISGYPALVEASGLAASRRIADRYWVHNDSGHDPIVYSLDQMGGLLGRLTVPVNATDWEDLAVARCPGRDDSCIWIADIGDNLNRRPEVSIVIVPEPARLGDSVPEDIWTLRVQYEDGPKDAEAIFVAGDGSRFWIIEKAEGRKIKLYESQGALRDGG